MEMLFDDSMLPGRILHPYQRGYFPGSVRPAEWLAESAATFERRWLRLRNVTGAGTAPAPVIFRKPDSSASSSAHAERSPFTDAEASRHVHCIVDGQPGPELTALTTGTAGARVYAISDGTLTALVSDGPLRRRRAGDADISIHRLVNEAAAREHTVIPFSLGSVLGSEADVLELLRSTRTALNDVLDMIRGKVEVGVLVRWNRERVVEGVEAESEEVRRLKKSIAEADGGATYLDRVRLARLVESALRTRARGCASAVRGSLRGLCVAIRADEAHGDDAVLSAGVLVERSNLMRLTRTVRRLSRRYAGLLSFECSGPRPPTSFVNVKLRLERAG
jgi:hypothetical protein